MVSVIIATRNRSGILRYCIDSLLKQTAGTDQFEVIVADNASTDDTSTVVNGYCKSYANIKYLSETNIGSSAPRNAGAAQAKYEWLAFIDDDGWVENDFIEEVIDTARQFPFTCFGGWFVPWYRQPKLKWMKDEWFSFPKFLEQTGELKAPDNIPAGIFIIKKASFNLVGGFPLNYGIINGQMGFAEENWIQMELRKRGLPIGFNPKLLLHHLVAEQKYQWRWHLLKSYRKAIDMQKLQGPLSFSQKLMNILRGIAAAFFQLLKNLPLLLFSRTYYYQNYLISSLSFTYRMFGSARA